MLYKAVLTFQSVDKTLVCGHSNESYWTVLSCGIVHDIYAVQGSSDFSVCGWNPSVCVTIQMKAIEQYFCVVLFIILYN